MKEKIPSPKIFTQESVETPKHDEFLIIFSKDSSFLKSLIEDEIRIDIEEKKKETFINTYLDKERKRAYRWGSIERSYDGKQYYFEKEEVKVEEVKVKAEPNINFEIINWCPEKAIMNNGYYIGSVDLYILIKINIDWTLKLDTKINWDWKNYEKTVSYFELILEFKPKINSYSEVLRQIKVYERYFGYDYLPNNLEIEGNRRIEGRKFIVLTYSECKSFIEIFNEQKISLINVDSYLEAITDFNKEVIKSK